MSLGFWKYCKIWLNHLMDYRHFSYITKLKRKALSGPPLQPREKAFKSNWRRGRYQLHNRVLCKATLSSPSLPTPIPSASIPSPLFHWYPQSKEILLNLSVKCWNSSFNVQGLRVFIVVVQVGVVKIYGAVAEALRKKETQDETQFTTKIGGKTSLGPNYFVL